MVDLGSALTNGSFLWQNNQFFTNYSQFYQFCDYLEGVPPRPNVTERSNTTVIPGSDGVGLEKALSGLATWTREFRIPGCKNSHLFTLKYFDNYFFSLRQSWSHD